MTTNPIRDFPENIQQAALTLFRALANEQRGRPEILATSIPANPGLWNAMGAFTVLCEHVGDLTHRMGESHAEQMGYGYEAVGEKLRRAMRYFTNGYGLAREVDDNLRGNYRYRERNDWDAFLAEWEHGADAYANAHSRLTVWNEAQWHAREAAVALGRRHYATMEHHLQYLKMYHDRGREAWSDWASMITVIHGGEIAPFRYVHDARRWSQMAEL